MDEDHALVVDSEEHGGHGVRIRCYLPNYKSWEVNEVKATLGWKMAAYFFQLAPEFVLPGRICLPSSSRRVLCPKRAKTRSGTSRMRGEGTT